MGSYPSKPWAGKRLFVGIDVHRYQWHITILFEDGLRLFSNNILGCWDSLRELLDKYDTASKILVVYEAGFLGFWLHDLLLAYGADVVVTSPNKIPRAAGDRVKTDRIDSVQLARYLQAGLLKPVWVPDPEQRYHREVLRRRHQLKRDGVRIKNQIKAFLRSYGIELPEETPGSWSRRFVSSLWEMEFPDPYFQKSFRTHLSRLDHNTELHADLKRSLHDLARSDAYREQTVLLETIPGVGWLTAIELLLELPDVRKFKRSDQIGAYFGLTPSQYSTGPHVRMGCITRQGKGHVRAMLVEAAWRLIRKDPAMARKYENIKSRAGSKRAIVAIARKLITRIRSMLLHHQVYRVDHD